MPVVLHTAAVAADTTELAVEPEVVACRECTMTFLCSGCCPPSFPPLPLLLCINCQSISNSLSLRLPYVMGSLLTPVEEHFSALYRNPLTLESSFVISNVLCGVLESLTQLVAVKL